MGNTSNNTTAFVYKVGNPAGAPPASRLSQLYLHPVAAIPESQLADPGAGGWLDEVPQRELPRPASGPARTASRCSGGSIAGGAIPRPLTGTMGVNDRANALNIMWSTMATTP